jgi:hypothetical protein
MRTDINKIDDITPEMKLNDILYKEMQEELNDLVLYFYFDDYDYDEESDIIFDFEDLYFARRVLSVIKNHDLPFKAAIGLYFFDDRLETINDFREDFLPDEDSDAEMFEFILELGYRFYDLIYIPGKTENEMYELVRSFRNFKQGGAEKHDE